METVLSDGRICETGSKTLRRTVIEGVIIACRQINEQQARKGCVGLTRGGRRALLSRIAASYGLSLKIRRD